MSGVSHREEGRPSALPRLYGDLAWLWPLLSPPEQYGPEAELIETLIIERLGPGPHRILELGAGGGHTLVHLDRRGRGRHDCVAVDLSEPMLAHARRLIPGLPTQVGDMRDLRLGQTFDVVLIHDAIDYLLTAADVAAALATAHAHLRPGGLAVIAPTYTAETFVDGESAVDAAGQNQGASPDLDTEDEKWLAPETVGSQGQNPDHGKTCGEEVTYVSYVHDPDPADHRFEMILVYFIREAGDAGASRGVRVVEDRHACGLFARSDWLELIQQAGLAGEYLEQGDGDEDGAWSLFVGTRKT